MSTCWMVERDGKPWRPETGIEAKKDAESYAKAWNRMTRYKYTVRLWRRVEDERVSEEVE